MFLTFFLLSASNSFLTSFPETICNNIVLNDGQLAFVIQYYIVACEYINHAFLLFQMVPKPSLSRFGSQTSPIDTYISVRLHLDRYSKRQECTTMIQIRIRHHASMMDDLEAFQVQHHA